MASAAAALSLAAVIAACDFQPDVDYSNTGGADIKTISGLTKDECCAQCANTSGCVVAVYSADYDNPPHACWLKKSSATPSSKKGVVACWPAGHAPTPPPPALPTPTPLPAQCYKAKVAAFDPHPVVSYVDGNADFAQVFNPSWIPASAGTGGKAGLIIRTQNCTGCGENPSGGTKNCCHCAGTGAKASILTFAELRGSDSADAATAPRFSHVGADSVVFAPHDDTDLRGTEDPRVAFDPASGTYVMFYTCWAKDGKGELCVATSADPTDKAKWTRHGPAFPGSHKSGALLVRDAPPHYLISGAGKIYAAQSDSLVGNWTLGELFIKQTLWGNPNVEAGPPPLQLSDGNYVFFHNSWGGKDVPEPGYQPAWVILDGKDPLKILARAPEPLWTPTDQPWMAGTAPYTCNVQQVGFLEAAHPMDKPNSFRTYFGGADAVVGTAVVDFERVPGVACEGG